MYPSVFRPASVLAIFSFVAISGAQIISPPPQYPAGGAYVAGATADCVICYPQFGGTYYDASGNPFPCYWDGSSMTLNPMPLGSALFGEISKFRSGAFAGWAAYSVGGQTRRHAALFSQGGEPIDYHPSFASPDAESEFVSSEYVGNVYDGATTTPFVLGAAAVPSLGGSPALNTKAKGAFEGVLVGDAPMGDHTHAIQWTPATPEATDLNPAALVDTYGDAFSTANDAGNAGGPTFVVGSAGAWVNGQAAFRHAYVWEGPGSPGRDLTPNAADAEATGIYKNDYTYNYYVCGNVRSGSSCDAYAWILYGGQSTTVNLNKVLPEPYRSAHNSHALSVARDGIVTGYVEYGGKRIPWVWYANQAIDQPPYAIVSTNYIEKYLTAGATTVDVVLDASQSYDPTNDPLTFEWTRDGSVVSTSPVFTATLPEGFYTFNLKVSDDSGNSAYSYVYVAVYPANVFYSWPGFAQPVNMDSSSIFKLGSTIPLKFSMSNGPTAARVYVAKVSNGIIGSEMEAVTNVGGDTGNTFRFANGTYTFNWSTKGLSAGTWQVRVDLGDGNAGNTVLVSIK